MMKKTAEQREIYLQYRRDGHTKEEALYLLYPQVPSLSTICRWEHWVQADETD